MDRQRQGAAVTVTLLEQYVCGSLGLGAVAEWQAGLIVYTQSVRADGSLEQHKKRATASPFAAAIPAAESQLLRSQ